MTWIVSETVDKRLARLSWRICQSGGSDEAAVEEHRALCKKHITRIAPNLDHIPVALRYDSSSSAIDPRHREAAKNNTQRKHLVQNIALLRLLIDHCGDAPITIQAMAEAGQSGEKTARSRLTRMTKKDFLTRTDDGVYALTPHAIELLAAL